MRDRQKILNLLRETFLQNDRIVFAYIYGSFINEPSFRDIDVAIYAKNPEENPFILSSDIKTQLSSIFKKEGVDLSIDRFDIQMINHAPFTFLKRIFKDGILLVDHGPELRTDLIEYVSLKYRECAGILDEASFL